jgi:hypothetical protein
MTDFARIFPTAQVMSKPGAYLMLDGNGVWWCDPRLQFWLKVSNTNAEIGTTCLARARACGASHDAGPGREPSTLSPHSRSGQNGGVIVTGSHRR